MWILHYRGAYNDPEDILAYFYSELAAMSALELLRAASSESFGRFWAEYNGMSVETDRVYVEYVPEWEDSLLKEKE
jgi:hypothetical protein